MREERAMDGRSMVAALCEQAEQMLGLQERKGRCREAISLGFQRILTEVCTVATGDAQQGPPKPVSLLLSPCWLPRIRPIQNSSCNGVQLEAGGRDHPRDGQVSGGYLESSPDTSLPLFSVSLAEVFVRIPGALCVGQSHCTWSSF